MQPYARSAIVRQLSFMTKAPIRRTLREGHFQVGMEGPSTLISATPAAYYLDQVFNIAGYPPGDNVVIGF